MSRQLWGWGPDGTKTTLRTLRKRGDATRVLRSLPWLRIRCRRQAQLLRDRERFRLLAGQTYVARTRPTARSQRRRAANHSGTSGKPVPILRADFRYSSHEEEPAYLPQSELGPLRSVLI